MLLKFIAETYPHGISFDPLSLRIVCNELNVDEEVLFALQKKMFCIHDMWFCPDMIATPTQWEEMLGLVHTMLSHVGYFSIAAFFERMQGQLKNINTPNDCEELLRTQKSLYFEKWNNISFCTNDPTALLLGSIKTQKALARTIEDNAGFLRVSTLVDEFDYLDEETLNFLRSQFFHDVYLMEIDDIPCWQDITNVNLPNDFTEVITDAIDTLFQLNYNVSISNLIFFLNTHYHCSFANEYELKNDSMLLKLCAMHYEGSRHLSVDASIMSLVEGEQSDVGLLYYFKRLKLKQQDKLTFRLNDKIFCRVLDQHDLVTYENKTWHLPELAEYLMNTAPVPYSLAFCYNNIPLEQLLYQANKHSTSAIVGLQGKLLAKSTWSGFKSAAANPRIKEWVQRIDAGDTTEALAKEYGTTPRYVKVSVENYHLFFKVCAFNNLSPEDVLSHYKKK